MKWLASVRRRNPGASLGRIAFWSLLARPLCGLVFFVVWRYRAWGQRHVPAGGPLLLVCNHQSFLDLVAIGLAVPHRQFHSMARSTLFTHRAFAWLIRLLNAFAVEQGKGDVRAVRQAIGRLRDGHAVLVFPEGGRTRDGRMGPFSAGVMVLIRRARPTVLPIAVDGCYDVWPIHRRRPRWHGRLGAEVGRPIPAEQLVDMEPQQAMQYLRRQVDTLRLSLRAKLRCLSQGRYPVETAGDASAGG